MSSWSNDIFPMLRTVYYLPFLVPFRTIGTFWELPTPESHRLPKEVHGGRVGTWRGMAPATTRKSFLGFFFFKVEYLSVCVLPPLKPHHIVTVTWLSQQENARADPRPDLSIQRNGGTAKEATTGCYFRDMAHIFSSFFSLSIRCGQLWIFFHSHDNHTTCQPFLLFRVGGCELKKKDRTHMEISSFGLSRIDGWAPAPLSGQEVPTSIVNSRART